MADAKVTALSEVSVPALEDLTYWVDDPAGTPTSAKASMTRVMGLFGLLPGGRLTLESGVPVSTSDQNTKTTLYYTPHLHDKIRIYDGTRWRVYTFAELSLALGTLTTSIPYDVFVYDNSGTLTLELTAWTSISARATALAKQDGVYVKSGAVTRLYLGTIYMTTATTCDDAVAARGVWNMYNKVARKQRLVCAGGSHSYNTDAYREWAGVTNRIGVLCGLAETRIVTGTYRFIQATGGGNKTMTMSIGLNAAGADYCTVAQTIAVSTADTGGSATECVAFAEGYSVLYATERNWSAGGSPTFFGMSVEVENFS